MGHGMNDAKSYHHGDLKAALLTQSERILETEGLQALTLRAVARAVGVSHAAPNNHFGDLTGLLSELAASGFERFGEALATAMKAAGEQPSQRMTAMGIAYVGFAKAHPGLFSLMFRSERLNADRPALRDAIVKARTALAAAAAAGMPEKPATPLQRAARAVALWSLVHGFAMLLLDGRLAGTIRALPEGEDAGTLLQEVLAMTTVAS